MHPQPGTKRLFLAVFPPPGVCAAVAGVVDALRERGDRVAWVKSANLHFTLRFLGEVDDAQVVAASAAAREAVAAHAAFDAGLGAPGAFPHAARARVLWLGLREGAAPLRALAASLERALLARGFAPAEPPFAPHLTIGRLRVPDDWSARLAAAPALDARFRVARLDVVRSTFSPGGSRYETIAEAPLAG